MGIIGLQCQPSHTLRYIISTSLHSPDGQAALVLDFLGVYGANFCLCANTRSALCWILSSAVSHGIPHIDPGGKSVLYVGTRS